MGIGEERGEEPEEENEEEEEEEEECTYFAFSDLLCQPRICHRIDLQRGSGG